MSKKKYQGKDDRLGLRINGQLKKDVQDYCSVHDVDMSELVTRFFEKLIAKEEARKKT